MLVEKPGHKMPHGPAASRVRGRAPAALSPPSWLASWGRPSRRCISWGVHRADPYDAHCWAFPSATTLPSSGLASGKRGRLAGTTISGPSRRSRLSTRTRARRLLPHRMLLTSRHALSSALLGDTAKYPPTLRAPVPYGPGSVQPVPGWMFCAAPPGHLVVPTGETAVLPWRYDRMGQPAARAAAARLSAGLGARLPVRTVRTRVPAFRVRTGIARAAEARRSAGAPQAGCRHPGPAGTGGKPV